MHRFYAPGFVLQREIALPEDEAHHLAKVMRLKAGDLVAVFDGLGHEAVACVQAIAGRRVTVKALEKRVTAQEPGIAITLAQALLKSDKMDHVIRDAVMLGAAAIQPVTSARIEVPHAAVRAGARGRQDRWDRTVIASVKQCGRAVVPVVHPTLSFAEVLEAAQGTLCLMFVEPGGLDPAGASAKAGSYASLQSLETRVPAKAMILIGPEGGWDPQEISAAAAAGVTLVTLGQRVLRADAAGALAMAVLQYVWKDY
jgi:16S rRNA (uracil1498-N3)-methyltransferase